MNVFDDLRNGIPYDIRDPEYLREAHGEMSRCRNLCWRINSTNPDDRDSILTLEQELFGGLPEGTFITPPFQVDVARCFHLGQNVFANHGLTAMSIGTITIEDGAVASAYILLAVEQYGLGACWVHIRNRMGQRKTSDEEIRELLGIPDAYSILNLIAIGEKGETKKAYTDRDLRTEKLHYEKF